MSTLIQINVTNAGVRLYQVRYLGIPGDDTSYCNIRLIAFLSALHFSRTRCRRAT